ncbi:MAG: AAA family ATPase [Thermoanaerobaculia bacterium]
MASDFKLVAMEYGKGGDSFVLKPGTEHEEIVCLVGSLEEMRKELEERMERSLRWRVRRHRCFFGLELFDPSDRSADSYSLFPGPLTPAAAFEDRLREIIHVPGLRGNPTRSYQTTAVGKMFPGTFESYVASIVSHWQENDRDRLKELGKSLGSLGLTWKVQAEEIDATQVELKVGRLPHAQQGGALDLVNIADVGFGVSQTLPVLVALLTAERGRLVYLEQPEIHLHPRAQVALASLIANAAKRGVRVVAETHSSLLLVAIQSLVAEGSLPPKDVILHWFRRNDDGVTRLTTAELDEKGAYGDWPEDFGEVTLDTEDRYLDAVGAFP